MTDRSTADRVRETLEALDVEYVFGYPGGRIIELFESIGHADTDVTVVRPRDERQASVMAEVYGRLTGSPGVLAGQGPWIGSLGAVGQMEARLGSSPMVILTEASERGEYATLAPYQQARGDYGGLSLPKILDGITKEWWSPRRPSETVRSVQLAFKHATAGRNGPCAVILDGASVTEEYPTSPTPRVWSDRPQVRTWDARPTRRDLERAHEELIDADRTVVIAGNGVHASARDSFISKADSPDDGVLPSNSSGERVTDPPTAYDELERVADAYDAAVVTSYLGKSAIAETHERAGGVIGAFGHEGANRLVSEADALLVVGCRLNPMDTNWGAPSFVRPDEQVIVHADVDSRNAGWVYPADVGLIGDARETLVELRRVAETKGVDTAATDGWALDRASVAREDFTPPSVGGSSHSVDADCSPIPPHRVATAIERVTTENTVVTADSGNNRFWLLNYLQVPASGSYIGSGGVGAMGWAPPAAVTASLLGYDAICVAGDGGFSMTMSAIETAVDCGVSPTFVVMNDRSLGMVRQMDEDIPGTEFHDTDFVAVARAMGGDGTRVDRVDDLDGAIQDGVQRDEPTVVDVRIDRSVDMVETLSSSFYDEVGGLHE